MLNLLWTEGRFILYVIIVVLLLGMMAHSRIIAGLAIAAFLFSLYFFRNPHRVCVAAADPMVLVCPADGKVVEIVDVVDGFVGEARRISIFLSPLDVHVMWIPREGIVSNVLYRPGEFLVAWEPKASAANERNDVAITTASGARYVVRQIAGFVARRIVCWVEPGEYVQTGEKYGMIRFGSRVDLIVPRSTEWLVEVGDRVYGGQTVIGRLVS